MSISPVLYPLARLIHLCVRRRDHLCFLVEPGKPWGGNLKAMCDAAASNPAVGHILILNAGTTDSQRIKASYDHSRSVPIEIIDQRPSTANLIKLLRAWFVFLEEYKDFGLPNCKVNLWHGIPIKKIGVFQTREKLKHGKVVKRSFSASQLSNHDYLIASSSHDRVVMSACFQMPPEKVLNSGLPRNDWLNPNLPLPPDLQEQLSNIEAQKQGRKLVLYTPTFRDKQKDVLPLSVTEIGMLVTQLGRHNAVLGMRLHPVSEGRVKGLDAGLGYIDCSSLIYPEVQVLLRAADVLMTDYSSTCLDFCLTGRPSISYCPDLAEYSRGFLYPLETVFPGPLVQSFEALEPALAECLTRPERYSGEIERARALFHEPNRQNISGALLASLLD